VVDGDRDLRIASQTPRKQLQTPANSSGEGEFRRRVSEKPSPSA
jgi:hypothetical protein